MLEWLQEVTGEEMTATPAQLALRLLGAWFSGLAVVLVYRLTRRQMPNAASFTPTLVLLTILVAMVTQVIGNHVARAFSLVGALSIVRFRTVVEDTHDIAFVIFAVVVGMAIGANHWLVAVFGIVVVGVAAACMRPNSKPASWHNRDSVLHVRIAIGRDPDTLLTNAFEKCVESYSLIAGASAKQGTVFDLTYTIRLRLAANPTELLDELNKIEGVQSVELKRNT